MKKLFCAVCFAAFCSVFSVNAQTADDEYRSLVKEYLQLTNTDKVMERIIPTMFESLKKMAPEVPDEWWQKAEVKMQENFKTDKISSGIADIYVKYLSKEELKDIVAFYKTPSGRKIAENSPAIHQDCMMWGQKLGMEVASEILKDLKESGYKVNM
ncbi:MAG: DUF2059 domain-containing protein [Paludibacteraceae bacterium]|nr:DUF2059 domain-containing protein [Paludibacteraceae bacterium]